MYFTFYLTSIINKVSFADSNSIFQTNNYIPLRLPISLTNLGNTCYLNSVLQILFQVNTVVPFDIWINPVVENSTRPLVSTSARQCRTRIDIPGTRPTGRVCTSTHRRENPTTAM